jgi:folylpolyglutamate synthase/dihydropteroate synthase
MIYESNNCEIILDVCHNPPAWERTLNLMNPEKQIVVLLGCMKGRDLSLISKILLQSRAEEIYLVETKEILDSNIGSYSVQEMMEVLCIDE